MLYEKPGPRHKYSIRPRRVVTNNGITNTEEGVYVLFEGWPPRFETRTEAERIAKWEQGMGKLDLVDEKKYEKRVEHWDTFLIRKIESMKNFESDAYAPQRTNVIQRAISDRERLIIQGHPVCEYCTDRVNAFETVPELHTHLKSEHREELLASLRTEPEKDNDSDSINSRDTEALGQVG
jgi:hypothetical protein